MPKKRLAARASTALENSGLLQDYDRYHQNTDADGVPVGDPEKIGTLRGYTYSKRQSSGYTTVDIPGNVRSKTTRPINMLVVASDCELPVVAFGDLVDVGGALLTVTEADNSAGITLTLRLE